MSNNKAVIERVEARLHAHIVDWRICLTSCRCLKCFQTKLSDAVTWSEELTKAAIYGK